MATRIFCDGGCGRELYDPRHHGTGTDRARLLAELVRIPGTGGGLGLPTAGEPGLLLCETCAPLAVAALRYEPTPRTRTGTQYLHELDPHRFADGRPSLVELVNGNVAGQRVADDAAQAYTILAGRITEVVRMLANQLGLEDPGGPEQRSGARLGWILAHVGKLIDQRDRSVSAVGGLQLEITAAANTAARHAGVPEPGETPNPSLALTWLVELVQNLAQSYDAARRDVQTQSDSRESWAATARTREMSVDRLVRQRGQHLSRIADLEDQLRRLGDEIEDHEGWPREGGAVDNAIALIKHLTELTNQPIDE